jgi:hypothetical protein
MTKSLNEFVMTEADLSIRIKRTPHQYGKSNSAVQNDEQRNAALRRRKYEKTQIKKLNLCKNQLFMLKRRKKRCRGVILGQ